MKHINKKSRVLRCCEYKEQQHNNKIPVDAALKQTEVAALKQHTDKIATDTLR